MILETGTFAPHALKNPEVLKKNALYQQGPDYGYENSKAFVLSRDGYKCQHCKGQSKDRRLRVHPRVWRSKGGSDESENLVVVCKTCHDKLHHEGLLVMLNGKKKGNLLFATQMNSIRVQLLKSYPKAGEAFGYITKASRQQFTDQKSHALDAAAFIATQGAKPNLLTTIKVLKTCQPADDYQRSKGVSSETRIPDGKILGFPKFDKVNYRGNSYFAKGRLSTGYAILMDLTGETVELKPIPKLGKMTRLAARSCWRVSEQMAMSL